MSSATKLEQRATRWLARKAFEDKAIDPVTYEFLTDEPERADEVPEFEEWLAAGGEP